MSDPFVGEIKLVAFNYAPIGFAFCAGQTVPVSQNQALFALITNQYGGDNVNFALPDFRARTPIGVNPGALPGRSAVALAASGGAESITLNPAQAPLAPHTHAVSLKVAGVATGAATAPSGSNNVLGASLASGPTSAGIWSTTLATPIDLAPSTSGPAVGAGGATSPVDLRNPYLATNFIIALVGIFPQRP